MKIEMKVEIDASLLAFDTKTLYKNVQQELRTCIRDAQRTAKEIVPKRTGALAGDIRYGGNRLTWWAKTDLDYAASIEDGARPHLIMGHPFLMSEPGHPDPLPGPVRSVFHPGNTAYKYMETALLDSTEGLENRIVRALIG